MINLLLRYGTLGTKPYCFHHFLGGIIVSLIVEDIVVHFVADIILFVGDVAISVSADILLNENRNDYRNCFRQLLH